MTARIIRSVPTGTIMTKMPASAGGWDVHAHIMPPELVQAGEAGKFGISPGEGKLHICGHGISIHPISDVAKLDERVAADRLDGALVSVPTPLYRPDLGDDVRKDYALLVNDGLLKACARRASRLRPMAYLPAEAPELAAELAAGMGEDWAGVSMGTDLGEIAYSDPRFDPLWDILQTLKLPLFIHPGFSPDRRLKQFYLENLFGNPTETTLAAAHFVLGGIFGRFPGLKVILAHGGGCIATLAGRLQRGVETSRPGVAADLSPAPLDALRQFHVDTIVHSPAYLGYLIDTLGLERILYGSDWPFPMGWKSAEEGLGDLDEQFARAIRKTNAEAVFGGRLGVAEGALD